MAEAAEPCIDLEAERVDFMEDLLFVITAVQSYPFHGWSKTGTQYLARPSHSDIKGFRV